MCFTSFHSVSSLISCNELACEKITSLKSFFLWNKIPVKPTIKWSIHAPKKRKRAEYVHAFRKYDDDSLFWPTGPLPITSNMYTHTLIHIYTRHHRTDKFSWKLPAAEPGRGEGKLFNNFEFLYCFLLLFLLRENFRDFQIFCSCHFCIIHNLTYTTETAEQLDSEHI